MKTHTAYILVIILLGLGAVAYFNYPGKEIIPPAGQTSGKAMSIESFVSQNITNLSPVKATLGGTFYVTHVEASGGKGLVNYEDGHNNYTADFVYTLSDLTGIKIKSFVVRN
jgi:hypothetical protein